MKRIYSVSFTNQGAALQQKLEGFFALAGVEYCAFARYPVGKCLLLEGSLRSFAEKAFHEAEGILFVGAAGIAVRAIAPFVERKDKDPAVLVLDDGGKYVIPILSGHLGGANELSKQVAEFLEAEAVITTATDGKSLFSPDLFAVKQNAFIAEIDRIKAISSEILKGNSVGFLSDYPVEGILPPELKRDADLPAGILISDDREKSPFEMTLHLIPRKVVLGVGCRKNIGYDLLYRQIVSALSEHHLTMEQVGFLASADIKKEEPALKRLQKEWKLTFSTFSAGELGQLEGNFTPSAFVEAAVGVDNVCERAAMLAAIKETKRLEGVQKAEGPQVPDGGKAADVTAKNPSQLRPGGKADGKFPRFLFRKIAGNGVTVAAVELDWRCRF